MIDIHTHILPNIDDGSKSLQRSLDTLSLMVEKGVKEVVLTPHYLSGAYDNSPQIINSAFIEFEKEVKRKKIDIILHKGTEVFLNNYVFHDDLIYKFAIDKTKFILVETNMQEIPDNIFTHLYNIAKNDYQPILAHPERYQDIIRNPNLALDFIHRNVLLQINAGSLLGMYGKRIKETAWELLNRGYAHFLASDNHCQNMEYVLPIAIEVIKENIDSYTSKLLTEINPAKIFSGEKIEFFYLSADSNYKKRSFFAKINDYFRKK